MEISPIFFYLFSGLAIAFALMTVLKKNPVTSAFSLVMVFFCFAGIYAMLGAHLVAALQILVYAGAIMVLFLFTVMLLNLNKQERSPKAGWIKILAIVTGGMLMIVLVGIFRTFDMVVVVNPHETQIGLVKNLGKVLYHDYLIPFELSSVLFLTAMVGAVLLGKKEQI